MNGEPGSRERIHCLVALYSRRVYFLFHVLLLKSPSKMTGNRHHHMFCRGRIVSRITAPTLVLFSVGCCVASANGGHLRPRPISFLSKFLSPHLSPHLLPQTTGISPPHSWISISIRIIHWWKKTPDNSYSDANWDHYTRPDANMWEMSPQAKKSGE